MKQILAHTISGAVWLFVFGFFHAALAYGEDADMNDMKIIEGSVWYRERIALPPHAEILVSRVGDRPPGGRTSTPIPDVSLKDT